MILDVALLASVALLVFLVEGSRHYLAQRRYLVRIASTCGLTVGRWESSRSIRRRLDLLWSKPHPDDGWTVEGKGGDA